MKPKPNRAMNLMKRATQLLMVLLVLSIMSSLGYAIQDGWECPCFSEEEFIAMSDGVRDLEPHDQISLWWYTEKYKGPGGIAFGGEEDINGDGAWTWVERSKAQGKWCFYQLVKEGFTVEERTISDLTADEYKACYAAIEEEYLQQ